MKTTEIAAYRPLHARENRGLAMTAPKVHALNPVFALEVGDRFTLIGRTAAAERPDPFGLARAGQGSNGKTRAVGDRAVLGTDPGTGQPTMIHGIDRLAPKARAVLGSRSVVAV